MKFNMLLLFIKLLCHNCYYEKIGNNDPVKLEDLPFDIPDNWMWVRLKNISSLNGGYAFKSEKFCKEGIRVIRISDFDEKGIKNKDIKRYPYSIDLDSYRILPEDILLCMTGGTVGKSFHIKTLDEYCYINQRVALIRIQNISTDYFYSVLTSSYISNVINTSKTSTNDNISMKLIEDFLVPLPPLNEQLNIIEKIKSFEPLINRYDELEKKITSLELEFPEKFKKSILQYAIEGKLVKQDPNDEPASVLLERIKTEKEKLIKEGKIKQDKNESYIYQGDDKNYYEKIDKKYVFCDTIIGFPIPSNWAFSKIGTISSYGYTILKREAKENDWLLELEDIECGSSKLIAKKFLAKNTNLKSKVSFEKGMILYSKLRPYLDKVLIANEDGVATSEIVPFYSFIDARYLVVFLKSPYFLQRVTNLMYGVKMPRLGTVDMNSTIIPVPPVKEQQHIVEKLELINRLI